MSDLTTILFGTFVPPSLVKTRYHRCGDKDRITACVGIKPSQKAVDADGANDNQARVLQCVRQSRKPITSNEVSAKTGLSRGYCNLTLCKMWKTGKLTRHDIRVRDVKAYVYEAV